MASNWKSYCALCFNGNRPVTLPGLGALAPTPAPPSPTAEGYVNPPVTTDRRLAQLHRAEDKTHKILTLLTQQLIYLIKVSSWLLIPDKLRPTQILISMLANFLVRKCKVMASPHQLSLWAVGRMFLWVFKVRGTLLLVLVLSSSSYTYTITTTMMIILVSHSESGWQRKVTLLSARFNLLQFESGTGSFRILILSETKWKGYTEKENKLYLCLSCFMFTHLLTLIVWIVFLVFTKNIYIGVLWPPAASGIPAPPTAPPTATKKYNTTYVWGCTCT